MHINFHNVYTKIAVFWALLLCVFLRYTFLPEPISGLRNIEAAVLHTALNGGLFIAVFGTFITFSGRFDTKHFYLSIGLTALLYQINFLTLCVYGYILIFEGQIGLPHEPFPVTKHNMYLTYFFSLAAVCLFCLSKEKNIFRTLFVFPVLIMGMGMTFYHTYQFFMYSQDALDTLRAESGEFWMEHIERDDFMTVCAEIEGVRCAEFKDGELWPDGISIEASPVLYNLRNEYKVSGFREIFGMKVGHNSYRGSWDDGQIDDTQAASFWAKITFKRENGVNRIVVHDFIGEVHKASFSAAIAFLVISLLWGSTSIFLLDKHQRFKKLTSSNPRAPWYAFLMLPVIFFVSNLEALQDRFHWYALFLLIFCGGWRWFLSLRFYAIAAPVTLLTVIMSIGTFKPEWLGVVPSALIAILISGCMFAFIVRNELRYDFLPLALVGFLLANAAAYLLVHGSMNFVGIPLVCLIAGAFGVYVFVKKRGRLNTLFLYLSLAILSVMSLVFILGINPYNMSLLNDIWNQPFVTAPAAELDHIDRVYGYFVYTLSALLMFLNMILLKILPVHERLKYA